MISPKHNHCKASCPYFIIFIAYISIYNEYQYIYNEYRSNLYQIPNPQISDINDTPNTIPLNVEKYDHKEWHEYTFNKRCKSV